MFFLTPGYLLLFLPISALVYHWTSRRHSARAAKTWLLLASLGAYLWQSPSGIWLLSASILGNYAAANWLLSRPKSDRSSFSRRQALLSLMIVLNLLPLGLFKYSCLVPQLAWMTNDLRHPLGISFFTFLQITYLIDSFQGTAVKTGLLEYALLVSFFPVVASGPLVRVEKTIPQFEPGREGIDRRISAGFFLVCLGLFKKVVISASLAPTVENGFMLGDGIAPGAAWMTALACLLNIYFDLSGYTDMAMGAGLLLGVSLPPNFNRPFMATNISAFWQRWHMTLTHFFFDYLFYPLLKKFGRPSLFRFCVATLLTMMLIGIWHGPKINYLLFGLMHGLVLVVFQFWKRSGLSMPKALAWMLTFFFLLVSFVIFSAPTLPQAFSVLHAMREFRPNGLAGEFVSLKEIPGVIAAMGLLSAAAFAFFEKERDTDFALSFVPSRATVAMAIFTMVFSFLAMLAVSRERFLYFAF